MDLLTFTNNLISALIWPIVVCIVILIFKKPIEGLISVLSQKIQSLIKAKYRESEVLIEAERITSEIAKVKENGAKETFKKEMKDIEHELVISHIEMGLAGCAIASQLYLLYSEHKEHRTRLYKSIKTALEHLVKFLKSHDPNSANLPYYERVLSIHETFGES